LNFIYLFITAQKQHVQHSKNQPGMGGGRLRHELMNVRHIEQSKLSTTANNVQIARNG
jgi:hypothetical protein